MTLCIGGIVLYSCTKTVTTNVPTEAQEIVILNKYIAKYYPTVVPKTSGLYFIETKAAPDSASTINSGDVVNVFYSGYLIEDNPTAGVRDGYQFDKSGSAPLTFTVGSGRVIQGLDEGVTYMKSGSEAKLIIPSILAYYYMSGYGMPAYSTLVFYLKATKATP